MSDIKDIELEKTDFEMSVDELTAKKNDGLPVWAWRYFPQYKFNENSGQVEFTGEFLDTVEYVNSFNDCAFDRVLDKYLETDGGIWHGEESDEIGEAVGFADTATQLLNSSEALENLASQFGLQDLPLSQIPDKVKELAEKQKEKTESLKKEVAKNEKENFEKKEQ